jgi:DNA-binding transcriptional LysR family regulator
VKPLDLKNIYTFVTIARELSFAQASHILHLSQPSVTARIQTLETELGKSLFIRNRRNIQLTKEGETFLPFALQLLEIQSEAEEKLKRMNKTLEGKVSIGATALWSVYILPTILGEILRKYPGVEFKVMTGNTIQITEMLFQNQVDIGLVSSGVKKQQVRENHLSENELILVCGPKHPFSKKKEIRIEEMLKAPMVTYQQSTDAWKQIKKIYAQFNSVPNVVMELNQIEAAKEMVAASSCVCFMPTISIKKELLEGQLVEVNVKKLPSIKQKMSMIYLEKKESYPLIELVMETLKKHFDNPLSNDRTK